jgi:hypothetical protein
MPVMRSNCGFPYTQKPQHEPFGEKFKLKNAASLAPKNNTVPKKNQIIR